MKRVTTLVLAALISFACPAFATEGLISVKSPYPVAETLDRMEAGAEKRGLKVFARIDHAAGAASIGETLRPTELLIFGNPKGGTPVMQCAQTAGIELPLKALAWEDEQGQVWLGYNDPAYLVRRHSSSGCAAVEPMSNALSGLVTDVLAE
ncbi:MAG: DUF302 domain-containing protein [Pseudomonas sp.]|uniref:DUF302 domain-containing protein n=1 Tax=Halopseudomonas laoshanensis TaxID=2268758 RepID=UPI001B492376|nr:DUF302 domain-containing protein [Pseudomonas sp.]WOD10604.1 DUF302 domain-containing protein [Pseudomonas sp. NyZ704]